MSGAKPAELTTARTQADALEGGPMRGDDDLVIALRALLPPS